MTVWAIADLHLSFGTPDKTMEFFGPEWIGYTEKIERHWQECVQKEDLVLIPGDISWAMHLEEALIDLRWIDALPGTKLMIKGNHDYWWPSSKKLKEVLPPSLHFIRNNAFHWRGMSFAGAKLWDTPEYHFCEVINFRPNVHQKQEAPKQAIDDEKMFLRELERLKLSLADLDPKATVRICLCHYPPLGADLAPSRTSALLEKYRVTHCVFGHLHSVKKNGLPFGEQRGVKYYLTSCDYIDFIPVQVVSAYP